MNLGDEKDLGGVRRRTTVERMFFCIIGDEHDPSRVKICQSFLLGRRSFGLMREPVP